MNAPPHTSSVGLSREQLPSTLAATGLAGLWDWDLLNGHLVVDKAFARLYDLPAEQGFSIGEIVKRIHPEDVDGVMRHMENAMQTGALYNAEYRPLPEDGLPRWVLAQGRANRDAEGNATHFTGFVVDITQRRQAERALKDSVRRLQTLADNIPNLAFMADPDGAITWHNKRWYDYTGQSEQTTLEWGGQGILDPGILPDVLVNWQLSLAAKTPFSMVFPLKGADGVFRPFLTRMVPAFDEAGGIKNWFGTSTDVSELQDAQATLQRRQESLLKLNEELEKRVQERTTQLEAVHTELEAFSYSISHDLRAPLRAVDGFSQAILKYYHDRLDEEGQDYLARIRRGCQRMADLINHLLDLSRLTRQELIRVPDVNLSAMAVDIANALKQENPERDVWFNIAPNAVVSGDPHLLKAALQHLLANAWKYTSRHQTACIEFGRLTDRPTPTFYVKDDGAGFEMKHVKKLFRTFQRLHTDNEFPGSGIGLATVARVIHRHAGQVWAEGAVEQGATFYFTVEP